MHQSQATIAVLFIVGSGNMSLGTLVVSTIINKKPIYHPAECKKLQLIVNLEWNAAHQFKVLSIFRRADARFAP